MGKKADEKLQVKVNAKGDIAYLSVPQSQKGPRKVVRNLRIHELIAGYKGPDVIFDLDAEGRLLGLEVLL